MNRPPKRNVTRFFIPLIDVLTLLFCIFLLMPLVNTSGDGSVFETTSAREQKIRQLEEQVESLRAQAKEPSPQLNEELKRLREEKMQLLKERLKVRVLEIDPANGTLHYYDPDRKEILNSDDARDLIAQDRRELKGSKRELYYLLLYPRGKSRYPLREQEDNYRKWFADVPLGLDVPGVPTAPGGSP